MPPLTQKAIAARWKCSVRTVSRTFRRYKVKPVDFDGLQPRYEESDVLRVDERRNRERAKMLGLDLKKGGRAIGRMTRGGAR